MRYTSCSILLMGLLSASARAQTVDYDIHPAGGAASPVQVGYNATVEYEVTIAVSAGDNDGLLFFGFDIVTDLGVVQSVDGVVWDTIVLTYFGFLGGPELAEPQDDDLIDFLGTQGFPFNAEPGIAQSGTQVLVRGRLQTDPGVLGTYNVALANPLTQLFGDTDSDGESDDVISDSQFTTTLGSGFQIEVLVDADSDGVPDVSDVCPGFDDNQDGDGDNTPDDCDVCPLDNPDDTDSDGVCDTDDGCPSDANKIAAGVCGCGTPDDDTDLDGTEDCNDDCPNDGNKIAVGVCGCGTADDDTDSDGTEDCNDGCPNDTNKTAAGQCGCGNLDTDTDLDGTADCNDGCPNDSTKTAAGQCGCNAADTDGDGDGVANCVDNCPTVKNGGQLDSNNDGTGDACTPPGTGQTPPNGDIEEAVQGCGAAVGMVNLGAFWGICLLGLVGMRRHRQIRTH